MMTRGPKSEDFVPAVDIRTLLRRRTDPAMIGHAKRICSAAKIDGAWICVVPFLNAQGDA